MNIKFPRKIKLFSLIIAITLISVWMAGPVEARPAASFTGTFVGTEPTFDSPFCGAVNAYQVVGPVTVSVSGDYAYVDLSIGYDIDMQIDVYAGSFNPASPGTNYVDSIDDDGILSLTAGTNYYFVVSELCGAAVSTGVWEFALAGLGSVSGGTTIASFDGVFDGTELAFDGPRCGPGSYYDVIGPYTPTVPGVYHYGDLSIGYDIDMYLNIYANGFDPSDPTLYYVDSFDDTGTVTLTSGTHYYFVIEDLGCATPPNGAWEFVMTGPGLLLPPVPPVNYPNAGEILIRSSAPVVPYAAPGEYAQLFTLPADYDGNGFDTYIVTGTATLNGETWYSIFIGGVDYLWVKASQVQVLR